MSRGTRDTNLASDTEAENSAKGKTSEHPSGLSTTDAAREKPSRKRRLEANNEGEVSHKEGDEYANFKRFCTVPKHDELKWHLPENLSKYTNYHFNKFIPEKDLHESILVENPVPFNLHPPRKMAEFMRDLIFEKKAGSLEVAADSHLVKLQQKLLRCYGNFIKGLDQIRKGQ